MLTAQQQTRSISTNTPSLSKGLYPTLWPADHGDTARLKCVLEGGLPKDLDPSRISVLENPNLPYPQWMYTRNENELFVYGVPSKLKDKPYFAKVHSKTLEIQQKIDLPWILYMGGALVHCSGDVFLVQGPHLYRFPQGDLSRPQKVSLPQTNGMFTQYNGLTVTHDGMLILKGWSMTARELDIFRARLKALALGLTAGGLGAGFALRGLGLPAPLALGLGLSIPALPLAALAIKGKASGASWREFFNPQDTGNLLLINPETLKVEQTLTPPERMAYGRMAMAPSSLRQEMGQESVTEESLVIPGDEHIHRWFYRGGRLHSDSNWSERYRTWEDGTFAGTGPALWKQNAFYTDNTAPIGLTEGYHAFRKNLQKNQPQDVTPLTTDGSGFMFWSTVVDTLQDIFFVWDSSKGWVEARKTDDLSPVWRKKVFNADCCITQASNQHLYTTDLDEHLPPSELMQSVARRPRWPHIKKDFVVLDSNTGNERLRVPVGSASPVMGMIVPGYHDDVFLSKRTALLRISQKPTPIQLD